MRYEDGTRVDPNDSRLLEDSNKKGKGAPSIRRAHNRTVYGIDKMLTEKYKGSRHAPFSDLELEKAFPMIAKHGSRRCTDSDDLSGWNANAQLLRSLNLLPSDDWAKTLDGVVFPKDKETGESADPYGDRDALREQFRRGVFSVERAKELGIGDEFSFALNYLEKNKLKLAIRSTERESFDKSEADRAAISGQVYRPMVTADEMPHQDMMTDHALTQLHFAIPKGQSLFSVHDHTLEDYSLTPETAGTSIQTKQGRFITEDGLRNENFSTVYQTLTTDDDDFLWKTGNYERFCRESLTLRQSGIKTFIAADEESHVRMKANVSRFQQEDHVIHNEGLARSRPWIRAENDLRDRKKDEARTFTPDEVEAVWRLQDPPSWHPSNTALSVPADSRLSEFASTREPLSDMKDAAARRSSTATRNTSSENFRVRRSSDRQEESNVNRRSHKLRDSGQDSSYLDLTRSSDSSVPRARLRDDVATDHLDLPTSKQSSTDNTRKRQASTRWDPEDSKRWAADTRDKHGPPSSDGRTSSSSRDSSRDPSSDDESTSPSRSSISSSNSSMSTNLSRDDDTRQAKRYEHRRAPSNDESSSNYDDSSFDTSRRNTRAVTSSHE